MSRFLYSYLEGVGAQSLLGLWGAVQELREADKTLWHHLATQIFYTYINRPVATVKMDRTVLKRIESFLMGDTGPEVFFEIQVVLREDSDNDDTILSFWMILKQFLMQESVVTTLEKEHFSKFVMSEQVEVMTI